MGHRHLSARSAPESGDLRRFRRRGRAGQLILVNRTIVYDIVEQMLDDVDAEHHYNSTLDVAWLRKPYPQEVTTTAMVSGDRDLVPEDLPRLKRVLGAVAGDWELASIAWVARHNNVRCVILRSVSDVVGEGGQRGLREHRSLRRGCANRPRPADRRPACLVAVRGGFLSEEDLEAVISRQVRSFSSLRQFSISSSGSTIQACFRHAAARRS